MFVTGRPDAQQSLMMAAFQRFETNLEESRISLRPSGFDAPTRQRIDGGLLQLDADAHALLDTGIRT